MIDKAVYTREMKALANRFAREISTDLTRRYFAFLSDHLDTDEFVSAAHVIYQQDAFWPPPVRFLEAVGRDPASRAATVWDLTMTTVRDGTGLRASTLDDDAWTAALRAVGGTQALMTTREDQLPWTRKTFIETYTAWAQRPDGAPALPTPTLKELTDD